MFPDDGITIYPPLSTIPDTAKQSASMLIIVFYSLWAVEIFLWCLAVLTLFMSYRHRKYFK
jgi:hypothetical protein